MRQYASLFDNQDSYLVNKRWDREEGMRFNHATQKGMCFKTYKLFISGIFHVVWGHSCRQKSETAESETADMVRTTVLKMMDS